MRGSWRLNKPPLPGPCPGEVRGGGRGLLRPLCPWRGPLRPLPVSEWQQAALPFSRALGFSCRHRRAWHHSQCFRTWQQLWAEGRGRGCAGLGHGGAVACARPSRGPSSWVQAVRAAAEQHSGWRAEKQVPRGTQLTWRPLELSPRARGEVGWGGQAPPTSRERAGLPAGRGPRSQRGSGPVAGPPSRGPLASHGPQPRAPHLEAAEREPVTLRPGGQRRLCGTAPS